MAEDPAGKPVPYVKEFDSTGLLTIGWSSKMQPVKDYSAIKHSTLIVKGVPQQPARTLSTAAIPSNQSKAGASESNGGDLDCDRIVPIYESQDEFAMYASQLIKLGAVEVHLEDQYQDKIEGAGVTWEITAYSEDSLKIKIKFSDASSLSRDFERGDSLVVTFWDTQYFKNKDGV